MNKKGAIFIGVIIGLIIYMSGVLFIPFLTDSVDETRAALDCTNTAISSGNKMTCLEIDLVIPYVIWLFISLALGIIMEDRFL